MTAPLSPRSGGHGGSAGPSLTIGQLAARVGVTVRAVRHYHARGLLREPRRDQSRYRRYDAQAVIDLIRIRILAEAGVPLSQVSRLLRAEPAEFFAAVAEIDQALATRIGQMQQRRSRLADLAEGDRLFLPPPIIDILDQLRALRVSEKTVQMERDSWILATAVMPDEVEGWVEEKRAAFDDPEFRSLYLACDRARDWDPEDPRLTDLERALGAWTRRQKTRGTGSAAPTAEAPATVGLLIAPFADASPAWRRLSGAQSSGQGETTGTWWMSASRAIGDGRRVKRRHAHT